jgi:hypothetical protein
MPTKYVWYVCYGSNLCEERFLCYIRGGKFKRGGSEAEGCTDKSLPIADKPCRIPHRLYFAKSAASWGNGGVAFLDPKKEPDQAHWSLGRMWKITYEQYREISKQEGSWYTKQINLGEEDGCPMLTFTNQKRLHPDKPPAESYTRTIAEGLKETFHLTDEQIAEYLKNLTDRL